MNSGLCLWYGALVHYSIYCMFVWRSRRTADDAKQTVLSSGLSVFWLCAACSLDIAPWFGSRHGQVGSWICSSSRPAAWHNLAEMHPLSDQPGFIMLSDCQVTNSDGSIVRPTGQLAARGPNSTAPGGGERCSENMRELDRLLW